MPVVSTVPRGASFVRLAIALAISKGSLPDAYEVAAARFGSGSITSRVLKAAAVAGSLAPDSSWGDAFNDYGVSAAEFFGLVNQSTIVGRLVGLRRMPMNVKTVGATSGTSADWVGEGGVRRISKMSLKSQILRPLKVCATAVLSEELVRSSDPSAESLVKMDMARAWRDRLDSDFIRPDNDGIEGVSPASITNGVSDTVVASGNMRADIAELIRVFKGDLESAYMIASPQLLAKISGPNFRDCGARGGEIAGIPVLPSRAVREYTTDDSPAVTGQYIALVDPSGIAFGENDGDSEVGVAQHATVEMSDAPDEPTTSETVQINLWQRNLIALTTDKPVNFAVARSGAVALLTGINFEGIDE